MGHGIEHIVENGLEIDCFSYAGGRPWHGLGQRVGESGDATVTLGDVEHAAHADWSVITDDVTARKDGQEIDGVQALLRDRDRRVLGIATDRYAVVQHRELGGLIDLLVSGGKASWESCGVLDEGRRVFYSARLTTKIEAVPGDETELFATSTTAHDGSATATLLLSSVRVVCRNTLTLAMAKNVDSVRVRHTGGASDALARARDVVLGIDSRVANMDAAMAMLARITLTERQAQRFLDLVCPVPTLPSVDVFTSDAEERQRRVLYSQDLALRVQAKIRELHESHVGQDMARAWAQPTTPHRRSSNSAPVAPSNSSQTSSLSSPS
jgi:phage/plasmid-like protein (TIGR03299 family)